MLSAHFDYVLGSETIEYVSQNLVSLFALIPGTTLAVVFFVVLEAAGCACGFFSSRTPSGSRVPAEKTVNNCFFKG